MRYTHKCWWRKKESTYLLKISDVLDEWQYTVWNTQEKNIHMIAPVKNAMYTIIFSHLSWSMIESTRK